MTSDASPALRELMQHLREAQALALELRVLFDYSLDEVASETGVPIHTVRTRLRLARRALRRRIEADPRLAELLTSDGDRVARPEPAC